MELYEHVFYTFAQATSNSCTLSKALVKHFDSVNLAAPVKAEILAKTQEVCKSKFARPCETYMDYTRHEIEKAACLDLFKTITKEVYPNG